MTDKLASSQLSTHQDVAGLLQKNELLNILSDFAIALLDLTSTDEVLWHTSREVVGRMGFDDCVIYLWNERTQKLEQHSAFGQKNSEADFINNALKLNLGEGIVGRAAQAMQTVIINDLSLVSNYVMDLQQAASELAIPIIHRNELLGVIDSESLQKNFYTDEHVKILTAVTSMLAAKLAKTKLIGQLESTIVQLEYAEKLQKTLFKIAALTYEDDDLIHIYDKIHTHVGELLYAKSFFLAVYNVDKNQIEFPYFVDESEPDLNSGEVPPDTTMNGMAAWVIFNNEPLLLSKAECHTMSAQGSFTVIGEVAESWLGVPINAGEDLKAALVVQSYNPAISYDEKDRELLIFVSRHICNLFRRKIAEKKLQYQALHDPLTGLSNRTLFLDRVSHALQKLDRKQNIFCSILYLDIDLFKGINDRFGHAVGDALLIAFSNILRQLARDTDTIARLGGDEFAIFIEEMSSDHAPFSLAERIIRTLAAPLNVLSQQITVSSSIGIALFSDNTVSASEGIRRADTAMYQAKAAGRGNYQVYDANYDKENSRSNELGEDIVNALHKEEFCLHYQPIIAVQGLQAIGFEALIRWHHPVKGWISPVEFIGYAEKSKLIEKIDRYVVSHVFMQLRLWREQAGVLPRVSINVSGRHFASADFINFLLPLLDEYQFPPGTLGIEITERAVIDNFAIAQSNIATLKKHQVRILLDDFGTGYSSLNYLHQLSLDVIKIDRTFVSGIHGDKENNPIISSIVALASALKMTVVAEGVETENEFSVLQKIGCGYCQGYKFAKPLPPDQAMAYFQAHQK
ncbi:MAG: EAL domain-containing protein [Pseudomonadota bacterium]